MDRVKEADKLAELIALRAKRKLGPRASMRLVGRENLHREVPGAPQPRPASTMDSVARESRLRFIRSLVHAYRPLGLQLILDRALVGYAGLDDLPDDSVIQLHKDLEHAMDCAREGVDFKDAGLI